MIIVEIWCVYTYSTCPLRLATAQLFKSPMWLVLDSWALELMVKMVALFQSLCFSPQLPFFFLLVKTHKTYSLNKFQVPNTVWFTVVTMLQKNIPRTYSFSNKVYPLWPTVGGLAHSILATIPCDRCNNHYFTDGKIDNKGRLKILPEVTAGIWRSWSDQQESPRF